MGLVGITLGALSILLIKEPKKRALKKLKRIEEMQEDKDDGPLCVKSFFMSLWNTLTIGM